MLSAKLTVVGGDAKAAEISLKLPTTIGRGRDVSLTLPHPLVSRKHCEIFERKGALFVRDLKSLNGTYVDSQRINGTSELRPDQLLTIGTVTFRAQYSVAIENAVADAENGQLDSRASQVLDMNESASADSDSKVDHHVSVQDKKTTPGRQVARGKKSAPVSLEEICSLLPGVKAKAMASSIDGLNGDSSERPLDDNDFSGINVDETVRARVTANDSALGSFIRKMPR